MKPGAKFSPLRAIGPGLIVAAAGIGAGDVITATVTGARFGTQLVWALVACVILKWVLNEGVARWQLATGTTVIEACAQRLPRWVSGVFFAYLLIWTFFVGGSLTNACGLAGHTLFPACPVWAWGIIHSAAAVLLVWLGRFALFENLMKCLVGIMVVAVLVCSVLVRPDLGELLGDLVRPGLPQGSGKFVLGIFGGIGGSMTMLCYGYWIRENAWTGAQYRPAVRADLCLAYGVTLIFAVALTIVASGCNAHATQGSGMAIEVATRLQTTLGPLGRWTFLIGFWCAVFTAMLAVWQGVPYLFADFVAQRRGGVEQGVDLKRTWAYRGYLLYLAGPPLILLFRGQPVAMVVLFTIVGGCFMPFLAALLLCLNNRRDWIGSLRNGAWHNAALVIALLLYGWIAVSELIAVVGR